MYRHWRPNLAISVRCWSAVGAVVLVLGLTSAASAAVIATGDPEGRYGENPVIFTVDPFSPDFGGPYAANIERGIAGERRLRQTFQNPTTFNVGQINLSFDVTGGSTVDSAADTGLRLAFYEVDDVLSSGWMPGALIREVVLQPGNMPAANEVFRFDLTGGDVFTLPQRNSGTAGYGLEISTPNALASDGNPGTIKFTNDGVNPDPDSNPSGYYAGGRYYTESGTGSTSYRDVGLSLVASTEIPADPGDVNRDMMVDGVDLGIIAANFRMSGGHDEGDLTGNGFIDFDDFGEWKTHYTGPPLGASAFTFLTVPEPASLLLLIAACAVLPFRTLRGPTARTRSAIAG